eukprot:scaffold14150_cov108-Isochrysis_galbana.AAC.1
MPLTLRSCSRRDAPLVSPRQSTLAPALAHLGGTSRKKKYTYVLFFFLFCVIHIIQASPRSIIYPCPPPVPAHVTADPPSGPRPLPPPTNDPRPPTTHTSRPPPSTVAWRVAALPLPASQAAERAVVAAAARSVAPVLHPHPAPPEGVFLFSEGPRAREGAAALRATRTK